MYLTCLLAMLAELNRENGRVRGWEYYTSTHHRTYPTHKHRGMQAHNIGGLQLRPEMGFFYGTRATKRNSLGKDYQPKTYTGVGSEFSYERQRMKMVKSSNKPWLIDKILNNCSRNSPFLQTFPQIPCDNNKRKFYILNYSLIHNLVGNASMWHYNIFLTCFLDI